MDNAVCTFQQLRKTKEKALRYSFHQDNYNFFSLSRFVPTGLKLTHSPCLGTLTPQLQRRWDNVLHSTSIKLINILSQQCQTTLHSLHQDIHNLDSQLKSSCTSARYQKFNDEITRSVNNLESVLINRRNKKIGGVLAKQ